MSICPTCPKCGAFAPWEISCSEVRESDREGWPTEERIISSGRIRMCVNGHKFPERMMFRERVPSKRKQLLAAE